VNSPYSYKVDFTSAEKEEKFIDLEEKLKTQIAENKLLTKKRWPAFYRIPSKRNIIR
jgi:hypothetical protein